MRRWEQINSLLNLPDASKGVSVNIGSALFLNDASIIKVSSKAGEIRFPSLVKPYENTASSE